MYVYGLKYVCTNITAFHPVVKRFINVDSYASTGQGILGHNMFAYCQNNPVMYVDTSGNRHMMVDLGIVIIESEPELKTAGLSANNASNSSKLVDDIENFDLFNTDEKKVMDASYFSAYKGALYIIVPDSYSAFSYGTVFFGGNIIDPNLVRHEYGHVIQLVENGFEIYSLGIALPSVTAFYIDHIFGIPYDYYSTPWEKEANVKGNASISDNKPSYPQEVYDVYRIYRAILENLFK